MRNIDAVPESTYVTDYQENIRALWIGLLAGPVVYALYFIVGYLLAEATCQSDIIGLERADLDMVIGGITAVAAAILIGAVFYSIRTWQRNRSRSDDVGGALSFMAYGGLLLSLLFVLLIGVTGVAVFWIDQCVWV